MCIRDSLHPVQHLHGSVDGRAFLIVGDEERDRALERRMLCLLYTSDAADDLLCVDLGGRRIIKKKITHA